MTGGRTAATRRLAAIWAVIAILAITTLMVVISAASLVLPGSSDVPGRPEALDLFALLQVPLMVGVLLSYDLAGAILAIRRPSNPIGWMILIRRFDRARYDGQQTVDAFAERLRDEVEFAEIDRDIHRVIDDAVRPTHVGLWLRERQGVGQ